MTFTQEAGRGRWPERGPARRLESRVFRPVAVDDSGNTATAPEATVEVVE